MVLFLTVLSYLILLGAALFLIAALVRPFKIKLIAVIIGSSLITTSVVLIPLFLQIGKTITPAAVVSPDIGAALFASPGIAIWQLLMGILFLFLSIKRPGRFAFAIPQSKDEKALLACSLVVLAEGLVSLGMVFLVVLLKW
jgi:hypothetical protein